MGMKSNTLASQLHCTCSLANKFKKRREESLLLNKLLSYKMFLVALLCYQVLDKTFVEYCLSPFYHQVCRVCQKMAQECELLSF